MNPSVVTKDQLEGVSYPIAAFDCRHPCLPVERGGGKDGVDAEESGTRMSRKKKTKVFTFLNNVLNVILSQHGVY